ncbi:DNA polymerase III subunit chi [Sphingomonas sp. GlSt437]|uniref:DNA polymerase III subunit chi n=1 Tax=Sphingomonas sp. GlSt437 TaxID=3389970 RepID=UPI003A83F841
MQVDFYHLAVRPLDRVLPRIAERVLASGERLLVVSAEAAQREALDKALWTYTPDSFLPHAQAGAGDDARQPVLIAGDTGAVNSAQAIALADGIWRDEALAFGRAFHFFDDDRIAEARAAWRSLADKPDVARRYWKQTASGWEQAA